MTFSNQNRIETLRRMEEGPFDILIIGGGITGAGIALDAQTRGMKVALVEMQDFAAGTSSRSTKLVHGGLRYLKQFEVGMVAEVGKERAIVYENGPHVTTPEWMLLPFHKGGTFGKFTTNIGLRVYDFLAGVKRSERRKMLSPEETVNKEPLVKKEHLMGGGYYVEYRTDDARLTIEVMKKAVENGALAINYVKAEKFIYSDKRVVGVSAKDLLTDAVINIHAKKVVNAAGPWVDKVRKEDYSVNNKRLRLTKGVHIVFDQSAFPLHQAVYFDTPDGRMVFAIPREGKTYVGTTDTFYSEEQDVANPKPLSADIEYILNSIHYMFPSVKVNENDVESSWAGVRPLIYEEGKDPSEISRKDEIWEGESGLITIAGGKLTGYRKMGETVVDLVAKRLGENTKVSFAACKTKHMPISGGEVGGSSGYSPFLNRKANEGTALGLTKEEAYTLAGKYGSNIDHLFQYIREFQMEKPDQSLTPSVYAQVMYAIQYEMAAKPVDFFIRRTGALYFNIKWVQKWKDAVIQLMARELRWHNHEKEEYTQQLEKELADAITPADAKVKI
jgi:glycerol-3-phosphate dehydrogenase